MVKHITIISTYIFDTNISSVFKTEQEHIYVEHWSFFYIQVYHTPFGK